MKITIEIEADTQAGLDDAVGRVTSAVREAMNDFRFRTLCIGGGELPIEGMDCIGKIIGITDFKRERKDRLYSVLCSLIAEETSDSLATKSGLCAVRAKASMAIMNALTGAPSAFIYSPMARACLMLYINATSEGLASYLRDDPIEESILCFEATNTMK